MPSQAFSDLTGRVHRVQWLWLMTFGVALGTLFIGVFGVYTPWRERRLQLEQRYGEEKNRLELLSTIRLQAEQLKKQETAALFQGGKSALTSEIGRLSAQTGVLIESVVPQPETSFSPYTKFQIRIETTADFSELSKFISSLENHEPFLKCDQFEIGGSPQSSTALKAVNSRFGLPAHPAGKGEPTKQRATFLVSAFSRSGEVEE